MVDKMENNSVQTELSEKLAVLLPKLRKAYGTSQSRLGTLVGKSRQHISKVERGIAPLGWDTCIAIILLACKNNKNIFIDVMGSEYLAEFEVFIKGKGFSEWQ